MIQLPRKRDIERMTSFRRVREPVPAAKKKEALARANYTCQWPGCKVKNSYVTLQIHHKNMKNDDNRLSNLMVLCPTHHTKIHQRLKRKVTRNILGAEVSSRIVKTKKKASKAKRKCAKSKKKTTTRKRKSKGMFDFGF